MNEVKNIYLQHLPDRWRQGPWIKKVRMGKSLPTWWEASFPVAEARTHAVPAHYYQENDNGRRNSKMV